MEGHVTIDNVEYTVRIDQLTPADVLPVFQTATSVLKTDSILLQAAGAEQNSAKKVLIPQLISMLLGMVGEEVALTIEPYYDNQGVYQGMYWHYNGDWLYRNDDGEMIRVDNEAAAAALAASMANAAAQNADTKAALANSAAGAAGTAAQNADSKAALANSAAGAANTAARNADEKAQAADVATAGASRVNAQLFNMTVTITDRNGIPQSVNIGFEIYRTYQSVAAMNADAQNVPQGKFVIIATTDPTSAENARLYCKNSEGTFTFLSDLDQAASAAWADWLENMKPQIEAAIATAGADHTQAQQDHSRSENIAGHPPYIADGTLSHPGDAGYFYSWDYATQQYVRGAKLSLDWASMTQAERDELARDVLAQMQFDTVPTENSTNVVTSGGIYTALTAKQDVLTFASAATCEDIITELT